MNKFADIYRNSLLYRIISPVTSKYEYSLTKRFFSFMSVMFKDSKIINLVLEYDERALYRNSWVYKGLAKVISGLDTIFNVLSKVFKQITSSSVVFSFFSELGQNLKSKPLSSTGLLLLGFTAGYLFFRHGPIDLLLGAVTILVAFVLMFSSTNFENLLKSSHLYRLLTYLLD